MIPARLFQALKGRLIPAAGLLATAMLLLVGSAVVLPAGPSLAQSINIDIGEGGTVTGRLVQLVALLTVLSLAPSLLVMITSFTRLIIAFSLLRTAFGAQQTPPNTVLISLALFLTFFIMQPIQFPIGGIWNSKLVSSSASVLPASDVKLLGFALSLSLSCS